MLIGEIQYIKLCKYIQYIVYHDVADQVKIRQIKNINIMKLTVQEHRDFRIRRDSELSTFVGEPFFENMLSDQFKSLTFNWLEDLPENFTFINDGNLSLPKIKYLPKGIVFNNN